MNTKNILVTGTRAPATLFLIRKLKKAGYKIFTAECIKFHITKSSNCITKNYYVKPPKEDFDKYIDDLINIIKIENIDLVIPTCEEIFYIAKGKDKLEKYCNVFCDSQEKLLVLHNKWDFYTKIKDLHIDIKLPQSYLVTNTQDLKSIVKQNQKYILKPIYSRFATRIIVFENKIPTINNGKYILQEFIEGTQFCSYSVIKNNKICLHSDYKTEYSANIGATIAFEYSQNKRILDFVKNFIKEFPIYGQIAFDFIQNEDGLYLIECNPRLTSGIQLFDDAQSLANALRTNNDMTLFPNHKTKSVLTMAMLLYGYKNINNYQSFLKWLKTTFLSNDVIFDIKDLKPFFSQFFIIIYMLYFAKHNNVDIKEISTYGIDWSQNE